jgi:hypothetical protein
MESSRVTSLARVNLGPSIYPRCSQALGASCGPSPLSGLPRHWTPQCRQSDPREEAVDTGASAPNMHVAAR